MSARTRFTAVSARKDFFGKIRHIDRTVLIPHQRRLPIILCARTIKLLACPLQYPTVRTIMAHINFRKSLFHWSFSMHWKESLCLFTAMVKMSGIGSRSEEHTSELQSRQY